MIDFSGSLTALATPFRGGAVDEHAFLRCVLRQLDAGTRGLIVAGTTGEAPTLTDEEFRRLVRIAVDAADGRAPVIAGVSANATARAIQLAQAATEAGAHALLAASGYYNKPSQAGLIAHFTALHDQTNLPILLYNVPGRTVANLSVATIATLSRLPRITGLKDATGDVGRVALQRLASPADFILLSGDDVNAVGFNAMGGRGCISVTANVAPELCARLQAASLAGDYVEARAMQDRLTPLHDALFRDTNPGPVKYALSLLDLCTDEMRLPLVPPPESVRGELKAVLRALGLIG